MSKKYTYCKHPQTYNEKKQNQDGWCRAKRRAHCLADDWDDKRRGYQKNWKMYRKKQYRCGGRGKRHSIFISKRTWDLEEYFRDHNIPHELEVVRKFVGIRKYPIRKRVVVGREPHWHYKYIYDKDEGVYKKVPHHMVGYRNIVEWKTVGYKKYKHYNILGYNVYWWSNKDIGIEHILKRCQCL